MRNYFNYFTEVEERFQQRRGSLLLLSTLDWALIEAWRDAGVPLEAVLRGIDDAFEKQQAKQSRGRARKVNGLAWCAQAVMEAAEQMREAATGTATGTVADAHAGETAGLERGRIREHLLECRQGLLRAVALPAPAALLAKETAARMDELAHEVMVPVMTPGMVPGTAAGIGVEELEQMLHALEGKLIAMLMASAPEADLVGLRAQAAREIAPYRSRMQALQLRQIEQQFLERKLVEKYQVPRLSLFYMSGGL